jgi:hypothetical protein
VLVPPVLVPPVLVPPVLVPPVLLPPVLVPPVLLPPVLVVLLPPVLDPPELPPPVALPPESLPLPDLPPVLSGSGWAVSFPPQAVLTAARIPSDVTLKRSNLHISNLFSEFSIGVSRRSHVAKRASLSTDIFHVPRRLPSLHAPKRVFCMLTPASADNSTCRITR